MDKANIIISIIIVVCIAAAVAAYGITNSDNPIFSDLSSMSGSDNTGNGLGNSTANTNHSGSSVATTSGGSSSGSGNSGSGTGNGGSGSSSDGRSNSGSDSGSSSSDGQMSYATAQSIANSNIPEPGCYAAGGQYTNGMWIFTIYDANGNNVGSISVYANGKTGLD